MPRSQPQARRSVSKGGTRAIIGVIAFVGLILSVVLHELFHALIHWGNISSITFFPNLYTIIQVDVVTPKDYDTTLEETVAYLITGFVMIVTIMIIWIMYDERRTNKQAPTRRSSAPKI